jgi:hypothetical protein
VGAALHARREDGILSVVVGFVLANHFRQPPVHHEDLAVVPHHDVLGLEVAVHYTAHVRVVHSHGGLLEELRDADRRELAADLRAAQRQVARDLVERAPFDELHREVDLPFRVEPHFVDRRDVRMLELAADLRLLDEAPEPLLARRDIGARHFHGDPTPQVGVESFEHGAHPSRPDRRGNVVLVAVGRAGRRGHGRRRRIVAARELDPDRVPRDALEIRQRAAGRADAGQGAEGLGSVRGNRRRVERSLDGRRQLVRRAGLRRDLALRRSGQRPGGRGRFDGAERHRGAFAAAARGRELRGRIGPRSTIAHRSALGRRNGDRTETFELGDRAEHCADSLGEARVPVRILRDRGVLAASPALGEGVGERLQ